jgi:hypothetical protein
MVGLQEVALLRWGDAMVMRDGDKQGCTGLTILALAQPPNSSPICGLCCGANKSVRLTGPTKTSAGRGASSAAANAPLSPMSPDPLRLAGTVVKVDIDVKGVRPQGVDMHR